MELDDHMVLEVRFSREYRHWLGVLPSFLWQKVGNSSRSFHFSTWFLSPPGISSYLSSSSSTLFRFLELVAILPPFSSWPVQGAVPTTTSTVDIWLPWPDILTVMKWLPSSFSLGPWVSIGTHLFFQRCGGCSTCHHQPTSSISMSDC